MTLMVLAGGSKPLSKLLYTTSRSLVKIVDEILLDHILSALKTFEDKIIVVSDDVSVSEHLKAKWEDVEFAAQKGFGVEAAICSGLALVEDTAEPLTIVYGDIYSNPDFYRSHIAMALTESMDVASVVYPLYLSPRFLRLGMKPDGRVIPADKGRLIYGGLYTLRDTALLRQRICKEGISIIEFITRRMQEDKVIGHQWIGEWVDLDTPWDYLVASRYRVRTLKGVIISEKAMVKDTAVLEPPVYVEEEAVIDHYAVIKGPAYISRAAFIGAHSFVREDTTVLDRAIVGAYSEVKRSIVMENARISSHCYIADSIIGQYAEVGSYTVTLSVPASREEIEVALTTSIEVGDLKVGAAITAKRSIEAYSKLSPAKIY
ncbi:MAG: hypothetical protein ABWW69_07555 [Pyrodictiaceae archaeon]